MENLHPLRFYTSSLTSPSGLNVLKTSQNPDMLALITYAPFKKDQAEQTRKSREHL